MTRLISDSEHMDHVTILLARVCAARLDASVAAEDFVRMVARLVDVSVAEALEDAAGEIVDRAKLTPEQLRIMAELGGVVTPRGPDIAAEIARWTEPRSTGAAEAKSKAEQPTPATPASETSAAPSTEYTRGAVSVVKPQGTEETGKDRPAAPISSAAPGSNKRGGQPALTDEACRKLCADYDQACATNGGKAPYGWVTKKAAELGVAVSTVRRALGLDARGSGGKPTQEQRTGNGRRLTPDQVAQLRADYDRALRQNGGELPDGWLAEQGRALGCTPQSIAYRVEVWKREGAAPKLNGHAEPLSQKSDTPREHTNSHGCWCRSNGKPSSAKNPWCSISKPAGTIPGLAGLQEPRPRAERYIPRRVAEVD